jgi:proline iminopeptidase
MLLFIVAWLSSCTSFWPKDYFWVERQQAIMPVWVRGNIESGVFVIFNHGGPGSSGTLESIIEVNPANGRFDKESPFKMLESKYAMVYWDQRHSGMSKGSADPNDSKPEDFGKDLSAVIDKIEMQYDVQSIFLIGQSWGHVVAVSYMTGTDDWKTNQARIAGYINYKGNHEQEMAYVIARQQIIEFSEEKIRNNSDVQYWREVKVFYQERTTLTNLPDYWKHYEYVERVMGVSIGFSKRVWSSIKSSIFTHFNGFSYYLNNKATNQAEDFMKIIATDSSMRDDIHKIHVPALLVYGAKDLIAPVKVGEFIYTEMSVDETDKTFLILQQSRHGAENGDREILQGAIIDFVEKYR